MNSVSLLVGAILLASPGYEMGLQGGGGIIRDQPIISAQPWIGARWGDHSLSLAGPLRLELDSGSLREADWDEWTDYGRVFRFYRYEESVFIGQLDDVTLGHGTVVRRFRNGVDDDHYRIGAQLDFQFKRLTVKAFSDQILGAPVAGARMALALGSRWALGLTTMADWAQPVGVGLGLMPTGEASRAVWTVVGADLGWSLWDEPQRTALFYVDFNVQDEAHMGTHLGVEWHTAIQAPWALSGRFEVMGFQGAYRWSPIDTSYLIERWTNRPVDHGPGAGARLMLVLTALERLSIGAEYADGFDGQRADLSTWAALPFEDWRVDAFWIRRDGHDRLDVFDPRDMLGGLSLRLISGEGLDLGLTVARAWRDAGTPGAYTGYTEILLTLERGWAF